MPTVVTTLLSAKSTHVKKYSILATLLFATAELCFILLILLLGPQQSWGG